nr:MULTISPECIES: hypothetical protein [unclassified Mycolicibacterium]
MVINRGTEAGVAAGMVFAVSSESGPMVTDPETGKELGRLSREKLRVRVFDVQPLFARAHTFVMTDDFYGLLQIPFTATEDVITVDVGDVVELVRPDEISDRVRRSS